MHNTIEMLFRYLPLRISFAVHNLPKEIFDKINEIRLRLNAPTSVTVGNENIVFDSQGNPCEITSSICATKDEIQECIAKLTHNSLYTCDEYITRGFIPIPEGGRAGVCGKSDGKNIMEIYSINLRLHRFLPLVAEDLVKVFSDKGVGGVLICSPPAMGKTTFLRSISYLLSMGKGMAPLRIGIADTRWEITAGMNLNGIADVILGMDKAASINILTRTMSPQIIICDEISGDEVDAVLEAQNTGVKLIASVHCNHPKELKNRGRLAKLLECGIFDYCVMLKYENEYKTEILPIGDIV